jgi:predicted NUDIX family NTP pyrophosphohydrolase
VQINLVSTGHHELKIMPKKKSAGLLLYRESDDQSGLEVLLVHPGGPFWQKKEDGSWTIPKGEFDDGDDALTAARREFEEETGASPPDEEFLQLKPVRQTGGKTVYAWAVKGDFDPTKLRSNMFPMEWPPNSGRLQQFPEIDRAAWLKPELAKQKINRSQAPLIDQLLSLLKDLQRRSD